jgi:hypothetical protein
MRRIGALLISIVMIATVCAFATPAMAVKPAAKGAGAKLVKWNLSGAVMPVPPYGSIDIPGSDTASKLMVTRPKGNNRAAITGVMNGLKPNTTYMVALSNGYTPFPVDSGWPGLFTTKIPVFTFVTDASGSGSWHVNVKRASFPGAGAFPVSIWVNDGGATLLISDTFTTVR